MASVSLNDRTADGEPHANATLFGGVERMKNTIEVFFAQPHSGVLDGNFHAVGMHRRFDAQLFLSILHLLHRFDGINDQVEHRLPELNAIA